MGGTVVVKLIGCTGARLQHPVGRKRKLGCDSDINGRTVQRAQCQYNKKNIYTNICEPLARKTSRQSSIPFRAKGV